MLFLIKKRYKCTGIEPSGIFNKFLKKIDVYSSLEELDKKAQSKV